MRQRGDGFPKFRLVRFVLDLHSLLVFLAEGAEGHNHAVLVLSRKPMREGVNSFTGRCFCLLNANLIFITPLFVRL